MRARSPLAVLLAIAAAGLVVLAGGCGGDEGDLSVIEGEPVDLGGVAYNISISRFLNPADPEDRAYLAGQGALPDDKQWFGVFMQIHNEGDTSQTVASEFHVADTQGNEYEPVPSESIFALRPGGTIEADGNLPEPESAAANGPIQGAMLLFEIDQGATENRPLVLSIHGPAGEIGEVELDI